MEGFPGIIVAIFAWYQIPDSPDTARFLNQREKRIAHLRLGKVKNARDDVRSKNAKLDWREIRQALMDLNCWITAVTAFLENIRQNILTCESSACSSAAT